MNPYSYSLSMPTRREQVGRRLGPKIILTGLKFLGAAAGIYAAIVLGLSL
jgi:hypothetical protein